MSDPYELLIAQKIELKQLYPRATPEYLLLLIAQKIELKQVSGVTIREALKLLIAQKIELKRIALCGYAKIAISPNCTKN